MIGSELAYAPGTGLFEKAYIKLLGVPINGLRIRLRRILPHISGEKLEKVLDAGCGRGVFSFEIAKKFPDTQVVGGDLDEKQLEVNRYIADKAKLTNLEFSKMDVSKLAYKEKFDLVLSVDNLEHIEEDDKALAGLHTALKKGGKFVLHVPAYERRWFFFTFRTNFDVPGHFRPGYTIEDIKFKVKKSGFSIVYVQYTFGLLENLSNNVSYWITKAEAKNRLIYALVFPFLNLMAFFGGYVHPGKGAGILLLATKS
jgi:2-polyprenyl-3-methyl-5-hydroxy-6-metoxy-1,4-benzoquinol methylase